MVAMPEVVDSAVVEKMAQSLEGLTGRALRRALNGEKLPCPDCGVVITRRALRWRHLCGGPPRTRRRRVVEIDVMREDLTRKTLDAFQKRRRLSEGCVKEKDAHGGPVEGFAGPAC
jgi:predicted RNA-binding Zn-ribbon protein involved in translation (DUF1610 family)